MKRLALITLVVFNCAFASDKDDDVLSKQLPKRPIELIIDFVAVARRTANSIMHTDENDNVKLKTQKIKPIPFNWLTGRDKDHRDFHLPLSLMPPSFSPRVATDRIFGQLKVYETSREKRKKLGTINLLSKNLTLQDPAQLFTEIMDLILTAGTIPQIDTLKAIIADQALFLQKQFKRDCSSLIPCPYSHTQTYDGNTYINPKILGNFCFDISELGWNIQLSFEQKTNLPLLNGRPFVSDMFGLFEPTNMYIYPSDSAQTVLYLQKVIANDSVLVKIGQKDSTGTNLWIKFKDHRLEIFLSKQDALKNSQLKLSKENFSNELLKKIKENTDLLLTMAMVDKLPEKRIQ